MTLLHPMRYVHTNYRCRKPPACLAPAASDGIIISYQTTFAALERCLVATTSYYNPFCAGRVQRSLKMRWTPRTLLPLGGCLSQISSVKRHPHILATGVFGIDNSVTSLQGQFYHRRDHLQAGHGLHQKQSRAAGHRTAGVARCRKGHQEGQNAHVNTLLNSASSSFTCRRLID